MEQTENRARGAVKDVRRKARLQESLAASGEAQRALDPFAVSGQLVCAKHHIGNSQAPAVERVVTTVCVGIGPLQTGQSQLLVAAIAEDMGGLEEEGGDPGHAVVEGRRSDP